jgi:hypothetical protein
METFSVRKTTEQFIAEARAIHGSKYDYSKVNYVTARTKVEIICPVHGSFFQTPNAHLSQKQGCRKCYNDKKRIGIIGIGILDIPINKHNKSEYKKYTLWKNMIERVYNPNRHKSHPSYKLCSVCDEWKTFSVFKAWVENPENGYRENYHLDKDILVKGNKTYSPRTCCFVPKEINIIFTKRQNFRGNYPIGVTCYGVGYISSLSTIYGCKYLGYYKNPKDAFYAYKNFKERYIKEIAEKYFQEGKITKRVYDALMKYEVDITD